MPVMPGLSHPLNLYPLDGSYVERWLVAHNNSHYTYSYFVLKTAPNCRTPVLYVMETRICIACNLEFKSFIPEKYALLLK